MKSLKSRSRLQKFAKGKQSTLGKEGSSLIVVITSKKLLYQTSVKFITKDLVAAFTIGANSDKSLIHDIVSANGRLSCCDGYMALQNRPVSFKLRRIGCLIQLILDSSCV